MLRQPASKYEIGRSSTLLKVKTFHDAEAVVVDHQAGSGRHKGRLGALVVQLADGTQFSVGTGFSDSQRESPPPVGSTITFRYQELSDRGVPRFPSFVRASSASAASTPATLPAAPPAATVKGTPPMTDPASSSAGATRRFELVEGKSAKFWEITTSGSDVTVHFGRLGTNGQTQTKSFADSAAAERHASKLIEEKTAKGYVEK